MKFLHTYIKVYLVKAFIFIFGILLLSTDVHGIIVVYPPPDHYRHVAFDPAGTPPPDSFVFLNPDPIANARDFFLLDSVSQALKNELDDTDGDGKSDGDTHFDGWTFDYSFKSLSGTLYINTYEAEYKGDHWGGAEIDITYKKGPNDPETLRWIQLITTTHPLNGATSPYIDPYPNDGTDGAPFYYYEGEVTDPLHFYDFSSRTHPLPIPFAPITWRAELYLVEWDNAKKVIFHDGIQWGWEMHPIPEPSTIILLASGLAGYLGIKRIRGLNQSQNSTKRSK